MPFHVVIHLNKQPYYETSFNLTREQLTKRVLEPYSTATPIVLNGRTILASHLERVQVLETEGPATAEQTSLGDFFAQQGNLDWYRNIVNFDARDISDGVITKPSSQLPALQTDKIELLCERFHAVARQLRDRHDHRQTLDLSDEYDVQDLMHALLRIFFEDVRPEEWTPSYAGKSTRMDFHLPPETVLEIKKTRPGLGAKEVGEQLIVDIAHYKHHPGCKKLICFVYDPEGKIANPRGIENDLSKEEDGFEGKVFIRPNTG